MIMSFFLFMPIKSRHVTEIDMPVQYIAQLETRYLDLPIAIEAYDKVVFHVIGWFILLNYQTIHLLTVATQIPR